MHVCGMCMCYVRVRDGLELGENLPLRKITLVDFCRQYWRVWRWGCEGGRGQRLECEGERGWRALLVAGQTLPHSPSHYPGWFPW